MSTKGLKVGDTVRYDDGKLKFLAKVVNVTSSQKAEIRAYLSINEFFSPFTTVNTYRKYMTIHTRV